MKQTNKQKTKKKKKKTKKTSSKWIVINGNTERNQLKRLKKSWMDGWMNKNRIYYYWSKNLLPFDCFFFFCCSFRSFYLFFRSVGWAGYMDWTKPYLYEYQYFLSFFFSLLISTSSSVDSINYNFFFSCVRYQLSIRLLFSHIFESSRKIKKKKKKKITKNKNLSNAKMEMNLIDVLKQLEFSLAFDLCAGSLFFLFIHFVFSVWFSHLALA